MSKFNTLKNSIIKMSQPEKGSLAWAKAMTMRGFFVSNGFIDLYNPFHFNMPLTREFITETGWHLI